MDYKFNNFLVVEKVSQQEIKSVLSDPKIMVGVEFEMVLDDMEPARDNTYGGLSGEDLDEIQDAYHKKIREYVKKITDANNGWYDYLTDEGEAYRKKIQKKVVQLKRELATLKPNADNEDKIADIEEEIEAQEEAGDDLDGLMIDGGYELWEFLNEMYKTTDEQFEYMDSAVGKPPPEMPSDLSQFYEDFMGEVPVANWDNTFSDPEEYDANWIINDMGAYPPSAFLDDPDRETENDIETLEEYPNWDDLPFTDYDIGDYHSGSSNSTRWRIELDGSLPTGGVEIISPVMPLQKMLKIMPKMFDFIKKHGRTTSSTGMHVNMSYQGKNFNADADMLKLMLFVDEGFVWKNFPERMGNGYTSSVLDQVITNISRNKETISTDFAKAEKKTLALFKKNIRGPEAKMFGVNTSNAEGANGRIEFRYLGGSNYERKMKEITSAIGRFGFYMGIALNEKLRKKEYILKLNRLHQKFVSAENKNKMYVTSDSMKKNIYDKGKYYNRGEIEFYLYKRRKFYFDKRAKDKEEMWTIKNDRR